MSRSAADDSSLHSISDQIDLICDAFESAWREGRTPRIEDFLNPDLGKERSTLLRELIRIEIELRRKQGEHPSTDDYLSRFPEDAAAIRDSLRQNTAETKHSSLSGDATEVYVSEPLGKIAHFALLEQVGSGGFGSVWRAWDERLERTVAIKLPRAGLWQKLEVPMMLHEARSAAQLRHPHIVSVHEVSHDDEQPYIVSEYIAGPSLKQWLLTHKPTPRESARICESIARALHHAHERKIVHRDLKPANVLIDAVGDPHITDFGLAKRETGNPLSREGDVLGTAAYMSPEQARGEDFHVDCRSDIYSLGIVLYELLAGKRPFEGRRTTLLRKAKEDAPPPLERMTSIPRDIQTICFKAISKDRGQRYVTALELADDLRRFLNDEPIRARRAGRIERTWRWCRRNRLIATSITAGLLAITGSATTLAIRGDGVYRRKVRVVTEPAGAELALVPLNETTGEPMPEKMIKPYWKSPVTVSLVPGDYLVVANSEGYGFHEVYRRVPIADAVLAGVYAHQHWRIENGRVLWRKIKLPLTTRSTANTSKIDSVLEKRVVTLKDFVTNMDQLPKLHRDCYTPPTQGDWEGPVTCLTFDEAVMIAEELGWRVPTAGEIQAVCTSDSNCASANVSYWTISCAPEDPTSAGRSSARLVYNPHSTSVRLRRERMQAHTSQLGLCVVRTTHPRFGDFRSARPKPH